MWGGGTGVTCKYFQLINGYFSDERRSPRVSALLSRLYFAGRRTKVRLPATAGQAGKNPCLSRHSPFLRATADAALRLRQGFAARVLIEKISYL